MDATLHRLRELAGEPEMAPPIGRAASMTDRLCEAERKLAEFRRLFTELDGHMSRGAVPGAWRELEDHR